MKKNVKRFVFDKLVRDAVPEMLKSQGVDPCFRVLSHDEFLDRLKDKLQEESEEVREAHHSDEMIEELADVLEVIHSLAAAHGIQWQSIEQKRTSKRTERGGFDAKTYVSHVDIEENNPYIATFSLRPKHYPEVT